MVEARWGTGDRRRSTIGSSFVVGVFRSDSSGAGQERAMTLDLAHEVASNREGRGGNDVAQGKGNGGVGSSRDW